MREIFLYVYFFISSDPTVTLCSLPPQVILAVRGWSERCAGYSRLVRRVAPKRARAYGDEIISRLYYTLVYFLDNGIFIKAVLADVNAVQHIFIKHFQSSFLDDATLTRVTVVPR